MQTKKDTFSVFLKHLRDLEIRDVNVYKEANMFIKSKIAWLKVKEKYYEKDAQQISGTTGPKKINTIMISEVYFNKILCNTAEDP